MTFIKKIDTVFVPVTDLDRSEKWYLEVFPFKVTYRSGDGSYIGFSFVNHHPLQTGVCIYKTDSVERTSHPPFNFYTDAIDDYHCFLQAKHVPVTDIHEEDGTRFFEFHDPDGNMLSVVTF